jgi:hypothetical protein
MAVADFVLEGFGLEDWLEIAFFAVSGSFRPFPT